MSFLLGFAGWSFISNALFGYTYDAVTDENAKLTDLKENVSIVVSSFNEPPEMEAACLDSILNQNIVKAHPEKFDIVLTKLVGKLTARDVGIRQSKGSLILNCDADSLYFPNWANMMLDPFKDIGVVATNAGTFYKNYFTDVLGAIPINTSVQFRIYGRNSAFRKSTYFAMGGFNIKVDQTDLVEMIDEEEIIFRRRMEKMGKIAYVNAPCLHQVGLDLGRSWNKHHFWEVLGREYWHDLAKIEVPRFS